MQDNTKISRLWRLNGLIMQGYDEIMELALDGVVDASLSVTWGRCANIVRRALAKELEVNIHE